MPADYGPFLIETIDFNTYMLRMFLAGINPAITSNPLRFFRDDQMDQYLKKI